MRRLTHDSLPSSVPEMAARAWSGGDRDRGADSASYVEAVLFGKRRSTAPTAGAVPALSTPMGALPTESK